MTEDPRLIDIIGHVALWGLHSYDSPADFARAMLRRLQHEGYTVTRLPAPTHPQHAPHDQPSETPHRSTDTSAAPGRPP
jgi:hypothetical protein